MYRSEAIDKIAAALAKAQGSYLELRTDTPSAGGDYASLRATLKATRKGLSENSLSFYQYEDIKEEGSGASLLVSVLMHESGQWISSMTRIIPGETDRATGFHIETKKRQQAQSVLGIAPSDNDPDAQDDNGTEQFDAHLAKELKRPSKDRKLDKNIPISKEQYTLLMDILGNDKVLLKQAFDWHNISTLQDLPAHEFNECKNRILNAQKNY
jgi:hypothetical protein